MDTRCKFRCEATGIEGGGLVPKRYTAKFFPVYGPSPENQSFFSATPAGCLELQGMSDEKFEAGKEYYIDITEAPVPEGKKIPGPGHN